MFLLNWLKERQFCRFVCPCIWVNFHLLGTNKWPSASLRSECHLRFHVLPRLQNHFWLTKESNRQWEVGNGCEKKKKAGNRVEWQMQRSGWWAEWWRMETGRACHKTDRHLRKQGDGRRMLAMGRNQRVTETERQMTGSRAALRLCLLPPSSPSINFLLQKETLTPSFHLLLGPINNLICCHMIALRPGTRLPSLLYSNELKLFRLHQLQWTRFIKAQPSPISKMADVREQAAVGMVHLLRWFEKEKNPH